MINSRTFISQFRLLPARIRDHHSPRNRSTATASVALTLASPTPNANPPLDQLDFQSHQFRPQLVPCHVIDVRHFVIPPRFCRTARKAGAPLYMPFTVQHRCRLVKPKSRRRMPGLDERRSVRFPETDRLRPRFERGGRIGPSATKQLGNFGYARAGLVRRLFERVETTMIARSRVVITICQELQDTATALGAGDRATLIENVDRRRPRRRPRAPAGRTAGALRPAPRTARGALHRHLRTLPGPRPADRRDGPARRNASPRARPRRQPRVLPDNHP